MTKMFPQSRNKWEEQTLNNGNSASPHLIICQQQIAITEQSVQKTVSHHLEMYQCQLAM